MTLPAGVSPPTASSRAGDLWGGLASMLVALPSSIAFGVMVYTVLGPEYAGRGAMAGTLGAAALGVVAPLVGRTGGLISAPCAPAAAVLSALVAGLLSTSPTHTARPEAVLPLLALTVLLSSLLQALYGVVGGGRLIKFIPYPVVSGYLSGVGILIALGQLPKLLGLPKGTPLLAGILSPRQWNWPGVATGLATIAVMMIAPRLTKRAPAGILAMLAGVAVYFTLAAFMPPLLQLQGNPLIIGPVGASSAVFDVAAGQVRALRALDLGSLRSILIPALTLSLLLSIDTLKTCVVLDALTRSRHNSNRELIGQGVGNLTAGLTGGIPGAGTMGPTLINLTSGGRTPLSGVVEGVLVVLALLSLSPLIAWVPIAALAGIMMVIAFRMFDASVFRLLRYPAGRQDFIVVTGVVLTAVSVDLIVASGVGVAFAILLFIRDQIHISVVRRKLYLNQCSSKTRRLPAERAALNAHGDQGVFCQLQGTLFFGTTDQLYSYLEADLRTKRFILLDMRRVQSLDYTAAHLFEHMQAMLEDRGGRLLFSGMPSALLDHRDFQRYLSQVGVVREDSGVIVFETLDGALEWMEERVLEESGLCEKGEERALDLRHFDLFHGLDDATLVRMSACMRELSVAQGECVFSEGDAGDELFLVRRGSVRVLLGLEGGKQHHLATVCKGDFFGELSFLDGRPRSAKAEAKTDVDLYALSRARFNTVARHETAVGMMVLSRLALAVTSILRRSDTELRLLEER